VQGHRDGHGFCPRRRRRRHLPAAQRDARRAAQGPVRVRIVRQDRKGRPEGRVLEIVERPRIPSSAACCTKSGIWLVAPEDKRYGQDVLIPKTPPAPAKPGQVVVVELTEPPACSAARGPGQRGAGRDRRPRHGDRDRGAQVQRAARILGCLHGPGAALPDKVRPRTRSTAST
jgi:ribonuclease R